MIILGPVEAAQAAAAGQAGSIYAYGAQSGAGDMGVPEGRPGGRAAANAAAAAALTLFLKSLSNTETNRYNDNGDNDKLNCVMFPYSERKEKCPNNNAHHAIPDHCWRAGGFMQRSIVAQSKALTEAADISPNPTGIVARIGAAAALIVGRKIDEITPGGAYYHIHASNSEPIVDHENGLAICVTGKGKTLDHGLIHKKIDEAEAALGLAGKPLYTTTLDKMQEAAANAISEVTGCDKQNLLEQMQTYYKELFNNRPPEKIILRADPWGSNTTKSGADPILNDRTGSPTF